jgi:MoxR-like ATPase
VERELVTLRGRGHNGWLMGHTASADAVHTAGELLERGGEFAVLEECLGAVRGTSRGRLVLVSGEAGIGKTALLRRFCEASGGPARVLWGGCDSLFTPRASDRCSTSRS